LPVEVKSPTPNGLVLGTAAAADTGTKADAWS
jgi:hypothetical protein